MKGSPEERIYGRRPVEEALDHGLPVRHLYLERGKGGSLAVLRAKAREQGIPVDEVERERLDRFAEGGHHQGVVALTAALPYADLEDLLAQAGAVPLFLILDGVEDPGNLGSLLRTADATGVTGVILPKRRSAGLTAAAVRSSAGGALHVPVARVTNLTRTLERLKEAGLWVVGTAPDAPVEYFRQDLTGPLALVIGGEGRGISRLVAETCDVMVRLPMQGKVASLNAAVAGSILLYDALRQRLTAPT